MYLELLKIIRANIRLLKQSDRIILTLFCWYVLKYGFLLSRFSILLVSTMYFLIHKVFYLDKFISFFFIFFIITLLYFLTLLKLRTNLENYILFLANIFFYNEKVIIIQNNYRTVGIYTGLLLYQNRNIEITTHIFYYRNILSIIANLIEIKINFT